MQLTADFFLRLRKFLKKQCFINNNLGFCGQTYLICSNVGYCVAELSDLCSKTSLRTFFSSVNNSLLSRR